MEKKGKSQVKKQKQQMRNGNAANQNGSVSCISKDLYDDPPQSDFILVQIFYNILHATLVSMSKLRLGQAMISILDYYMIKIENTLDFCVPDSHEFAAQKVIEKHKRTLPIKDRPMSWLLFIPALIFLRMLRFIFSVWSIIFGKGEVTAQQMQSKVIAFRRYYRSIRHYGITSRWNEDDIKNMERRKQWFMWRVYYQLYEMIFMTKPLVESHQHAHKNGQNGKAHKETQVTSVENGHQKETLNVSSCDTSDEELNAEQMLDKYADMNDSTTADPDYVPQETDDDEGNSSDSDLPSDSDEEKTESQQKLNDDYTRDDTKNTSGNAHSSDIFKNYQWLSDEKTLEKITKFLEAAQAADLKNFSDEIFYSPIDSPPEAKAREFNSNPELYNNQETMGNEFN